ncbi:MAG: four-carbon acid sugar kinase family protein [Cyclobacteriaceae bacterium]|nr:four-carbon acid sugar kinase family protein [Cyclobacteriaceae bacterium]
MEKLLIIADDLTGAIDAGVHFAAKGIPTVVIPDFTPGEFPENKTPEADVVVINTESRHIPATQAAEKVAMAAGFGLKLGAGIIYKKTDSTMRGNIGAELDALMKTTGRKKIPFIPAYPALRRFTRKGFHYVGDKPLHQTDFARDPLEPVITSYLPEILRKRSNCITTLMSYPYREGIQDRENIENEILIYDCTSERDLEKIEKHLAEHHLFGLLAGSAAVGSILARRLVFSAVPAETIVMIGPSLLVNGSLNPVTMEQVSLIDSPRIKKFCLDPGFLDPAETGMSRINEFIRQIGTGGQDGSDILVNSTESRDKLEQYHLNKYGSPVPARVYADAAGLLGKLTAGVLRSLDFKQMLVIGGDTLMALIRELGIRNIRPLAEIFPGVVISVIFIYGKEKYLITKPGGYGDPGTIVRILAYIKNKK